MDRLHVIGAGAIGCLLAGSLVRHGGKPVTLLTRHSLDASMALFPDRQTLELCENMRWHRVPIEVDVTRRQFGPHLDLSHLVCVTKAYQTVEALRETRHRWRPTTNCMLLQNGMGIVDEVNVEFGDRRPKLALAITSMAAVREAPLRVRHTGLGTTYLHNIDWPRPDYELWLDYLTRALPDWLIEDVSSTEAFRHRQLMKLIVNACLNPLATLFECVNGRLLDYRPVIGPLIKTLIDEAIRVFRHDASSQQWHLMFDEIESYVWHIIGHTYHNENSMLQDIRMRHRTEIDYLNGYIVRQAATMGVPCPNHTLLLRLIHAKEQLCSKREPSTT